MKQVIALADQIARLGRLDPDHRRKRRRQGSDGALRPQEVAARATSRSSPSTAPPSRRTCWKANCSATRRAPSPARWRAGSASSRKPTAARCCSTKSPRWTCGCRPSCCARCRSARSTASAAASRCRSTSASSRRPTATSAQLVRAGEFREDLLYRLNVVNLRIPPLRERQDDLAALAHFFIEKYARANGRPARRLSQEALGASAGASLARQRARA